MTILHATAALLLQLASATAAAVVGHRIRIAPGVSMPAVSNGAVVLGQQSVKQTAALELWFEKGGRGVDTAFNYGNQEAVGWAISNASASVRSELVLTTKIPCVASAAAAVQHIETDMQRLGVPQVDLLLIHSPGYGEPPQGQPASCWGYHPCCASDSELQATWAGLEQALAKNYTRAIGVSNFRTSHLDAVAKTAKVLPAVNQAQFYVGAHDDAAVARGKELGITFEAYSPLGPWCGVSTKCKSSKPVLKDPTVLKVAAAHGVSAAEVGMRWVLQLGHALVTASSEAAYDVEDISGVWNFTLTAGEMAELSAVGHNTTGQPAAQ
jgi:2,5-diketo-D-gluconate reductase A